MSHIQYPLEIFQGDLHRAKELLELVKTFRDFASSGQPDGMDSQDFSWPEAASLYNLAPKLRTDLPVLSGSILLYACGRFEFFVREVVVAVADGIVDSASDYSKLPEAFRKEIFERTLLVAKSPRKFGFDVGEAERLISSLGSHLTTDSQETLPIETKLLAITESNMNSQMLAEIFKRVSISNIWQEIGKQAKLKTFFSTSKDAECTQKAKSHLDMLMKERNSLSHPTGSTSFPDPDGVLESCKFLGILASILVEVAQIPQSE